MPEPGPDGAKTAIPTGIIQRVMQGALSLANLGGPRPPDQPLTGQQNIPTASERSVGLFDLFTGWFGPNVPPRPIAPDETKARASDFIVGYNLSMQPRAGEPINFAQLRNLADAEPLTRLAIETRKDQMAKLDWSILPRKGQNTSSRAKPPPIASDIEDFLAYPDQVHDWDSWLRTLLEDVFVIDAPCIYVRKDADGALEGLEVVDGATIKVIIDKDGRTPMPPYPAYQQILHGLPANEYTFDELIYRPRNPRPHKFYGYSPVEQLVLTINTAIRRQIMTLQYFTEGNIPEAIIGVPPEWTITQIKEFQTYWDSILEGNTAQRRHAKFVPGGTQFNRTQFEQSLKNEFDEWLARVVCYAFSLPPFPFIRQMNRSAAETMKETAIDEGLAPLMVWIKNFMDYILDRFFGQPGLEFVWDDIKDQEPQVAAAIAAQQIQLGVRSIDEVRGDLGLEPIGMDHALWGVGPHGITFVRDLIKARDSGILMPQAPQQPGLGGYGASPSIGYGNQAKPNPLEGVPYQVLDAAGLGSKPPTGPGQGGNGPTALPTLNADPVVRAALGKALWRPTMFKRAPHRRPHPVSEFRAADYP